MKKGVHENIFRVFPGERLADPHFFFWAGGGLRLCMSLSRTWPGFPPLKNVGGFSKNNCSFALNLLKHTCAKHNVGTSDA